MYNKVIWSIIWVQITEIILNVQIFYSFLSFILFRREKNEPRKAADCISSAKNHSRFSKRCKTTPFGALICAALLTKNFPDFINASELRSESICNIATLVVRFALTLQYANMLIY